MGTIGAAAALLFALTAVTAPVDAVVGGRDTAPGEGTFTVALLAGDGSHLCGASVVAPTWVLSAAHCAQAVADGVVPGPISVAIGRTSLSDASAGQVHAVSQVLVHPGFEPTTLANDAALLRLATPTSVAPIRLAGPGDDALEAEGTPARVYGWGLILPQIVMPLLPLPSLPPSADHLQVADVPIVGDAQCQAQYVPLLEVLGQPHFMAGLQVCAAALLKDACFGDSGGPLVVGSVQVGIVSTGLGCAIPTHAGLYAEVNAPPIRDWIRSQVGS